MDHFGCDFQSAISMLVLQVNPGDLNIICCHVYLYVCSASLISLLQAQISQIILFSFKRPRVFTLYVSGGVVVVGGGG